VVATGFGLLHLGLAGAPANYLVMNAAALVLGLIVAGMLALLPRAGRAWIEASIVAIAIGLLLTAIAGATVDGATRWVRVGGLFVESSMVLLPVMAIGFARTRGSAGAAGIAIAALALALQPDRAMAAALAAGMLALLVSRPERNVVLAAAAGAAGLVAALLRVDALPAAPFVEHVFSAAFAATPVAGFAACLGVAALMVPAVIGYRRGGQERDAYLVFGTVWAAIVAASALGNYPTPLVGYGGSAILGYTLCIAALPRAGSAARRARDGGVGTGDDAGDRSLMVGTA
jgi:hypothetical protein